MNAKRTLEKWLRKQIGRPAASDMESARGAQSILPHHGPHAYGDDGPLDEFRARRRNIMRQHQDCAEEIGVSWTEYCRLMQADDDEQAQIAERQASGYYVRRDAAEQIANRKAIGLPDDVLPATRVLKINGGLVVLFEGHFIRGEFGVVDGRPVVDGKRL